MGNPKQKWTAEEEEALRAGARVVQPLPLLPIQHRFGSVKFQKSVDFIALELRARKGP